ncbi:phage major capsid protein [Mycobacterium eburneum]|nr:phage major capsid protein [Mycobacterium eburneum]TDH48498.1 phage major capsid protein [Mycobacterium eburneum]
MNRDELRKRAKQLETEVRAKTAQMESGEITGAEYNEFVEKAYTESENIGTTLKNFDRALAMSAPPEMEPVARKSADPDDISPMQAKAIMDRYAHLKRAATEKLPQQAFTFDLGIKAPGFRDGSLGFKTQGVSGLQGEGASGTTQPSPLSGAGSQAAGATDFFLTGPGGPDITPQWIPGILELRWYENIIASLMPSFPVDSPVVSYVRETAWTNNAAATWEGSTFPTSTNTIERYTEQVGKVTNISRVTDEEIQDSNYFWALVQKRTTMAVTRQEEVQLLAGAGMPGVDGLLNRSGGFTQPQTVSALTNVQIPNQSNPGVGATSQTVASVTPGRQIVGAGTLYPDGHQIVEGVLAALTDIRINHFFEPDAIVMNPLDWFIVRTMTDNNGQYMAGSMFGYDYGNRHQENPAVQATDVGLTLWGKRVAVTPAIPQGLLLVGDFTDGTAVLRRGGMRVEIVNTNGTDFEQGMWTMRAYTRVGLAVYRPELFELVQLVAG